MERPQRPFSHLAIRPYPIELVHRTTLRDGTPIVLRPIRAEDEPFWQELLERCSDESIRFRFRALLKRTAHEVATRYCFIDYDREMAIVAELEGADHPVLIGMGNLFGAPDGESAEYAVLVADDWQRKGLGTLLTSSASRSQTAGDEVASTPRPRPDNSRMLSLFQTQGFQIDGRDNEFVRLSKVLRPRSE